MENSINNARRRYKTVVVSDIHLGTSHSKTEEVSQFLQSVDCDTLILNGDIIDGWHLKKNGLVRWKSKHTSFFKVIMKMMENHGTRVVYVRGNHDDFLEPLTPLNMGNITIVRDFVYESNNRRYFVTHGDIFDSVTTNMKWLAKLGDTGYTFLLWLNKIYNNYRTRRGLPYYSLSQTIKGKVKSAVSYISDFEKTLVDFARQRHCDGIICGHIHHPANTYYDEIHYLNSGDWVESLSALVEDDNGQWQVVHYNDVKSIRIAS